MFELKYKITERDIKDVNFKIALWYFVMYLIVSLAGIGIGIAAIVTRISTTIFVMGIILVILGALLLICSVLLMISPMNFVLSALMADESLERTVKIGDNGITISADGQPNDITLSYYEIIKVKNKKMYLLAYLDKAQVLMIKDAVVSGGTLAELYEFLRAKLNSRGAALTENSTVKASAESAEDASAPVAEGAAPIADDSDDVEKTGDNESVVSTDGEN